MKELALHFLDLVENSIRARATRILLSIVEKVEEDRLEVTIQDDGEGMDEVTLQRIWDPFFSGQKKKVGLGIPLFAQVVEQCEGKIEISSQRGQGTTLRAFLKRSHIDLPPLGNLPETLALLVVLHPEVEWELHHSVNGKAWSFRSREVLAGVEQEDVRLMYPHLKNWFQEKEDFLREGNGHEN
ncbi:MAG: ATP-binding protein [Candidatus Caldatribacteriaceae bacterium]